MEIVGDNGAGPFEGRIGDVPMSALCRTIEINLRDTLDENALLEPVALQDNFTFSV